MAKIERTEPTDLTNGDWLNGNEYASDGVEEAGGVLSLESGETEGYRVSPELDVGAISKVGSSKLEWTGDADISSSLTTLDEGPAVIQGDGIDDRVNMPNKVDLPGDQTVMVWVKMLSITSPTGQWLLNCRTGNQTNRSWQIIYSKEQDTFRVTFFVEDNSFININIVQSPEINRWYHLAFTFESGVALRGYFDGQLIDTAATELGPFNTATTMSMLYADWRSGSTLYANAQLGQTKIWSRVLSQSEIQYQMYNDPDLTDTDLAHWWAPEKITGSTLPDLVGGNNGVITGAQHVAGESPQFQQATNGQPIPGISPGDDLTGKKVYVQQRFSRATTGDPSPTLTSLTLEVDFLSTRFINPHKVLRSS